MIERKIDVATDDGMMNTYIFHPDEGGPYPVVVVYHDGMAVRTEMSDMCRRLASIGYFVTMHNMFYRTQRSMDLDHDRIFVDPALETQLLQLREAVSTLTNTRGLADSIRLIEHLDTEPMARRGVIGALGYCLGPRHALMAAARFPDRVASVASIHGTGFITDQPDSVHIAIPSIRSRLYFACAENDDYWPNERMAVFARMLDEHAIENRIELYPGTEHGFVFPSRRPYHKLSAERQWQRVLSLFGATLHQDEARPATGGSGRKASQT